MRTRTKICGLRRREDAATAAAFGVDAIGLVFVQASPRCVTIEQAREVLSGLPAFVEPVGLFVNAEVSAIRQTAAALALGCVQLHGDEDPAMVASLAPLRVIKAMSLPESPDDARVVLDAWRDGPTNLTGLMIDAPHRPGQLPGGTGRSADWTGLARLREQGAFDGLPPLILAGGLTPDNVADAIRVVQPYAVDVSSGAESQRGVKSPALIQAFLEAVQMTAARSGAQRR